MFDREAIPPHLTNSRAALVAAIAFVAVIRCTTCCASAGDWPAWRFDAGHTAASPSELPDQLQLSWTREYTPRRQVWDDPLNNDLMPYDRVFEPVVKGGRMFIGFNDTDKVVALDAASGDELWRFYTAGPVRLPPVAHDDVVLVCSDDGYLYCLHADTGLLKWKRRGGPTDQQVIGNHRLISMWPARGGPVVEQGRVYFAASIWPFMGTFIYCLDADSGETIWLNDGISADYIQQPHSAPSFAGVAPQGTMTLVGDHLLVPGGRSVPAALDRKTGKLLFFHLNAGGKGNGGSLVLGRGSEFYVHTRVRGVRAYNLESGRKTAFMINEPVLAAKEIYAADQTDKGPVVRAYDPEKKVVWEVAANGTGDLIQAGGRLYAAGGGKLSAIDIPPTGAQPHIAWSLPVADDVQRLLAASDRLFAVTQDGSIHCYGDPTARTGTISGLEGPSKDAPAVSTEKRQQARRLLAAAGASDGHALWLGLDDPALLSAVLHESNLHIIAIDEQAERVDRWRQAYDRAGWYGDRVSIMQASVSSFQPPPYLANMIYAGEEATHQLIGLPRTEIRRLYESVRPYGGSLVLQAAAETGNKPIDLAAVDLERAKISQQRPYLIAQRHGPLVGSADWTHQYGDVANTVKSNDRRVKLPLGLLWFGGSSNMDVLPRHGHGPPEQVVGGRVFVEGINSLSARDVYTGRVLWKRDFDDLGTFDVYYDATYKDTPLNTAYNQVHIPGANGRGTNYVATSDAVYVLEGAACHVLNEETGETERMIRLPEIPSEPDRQWGYIGVYKDVLLAGAGFADYGQRLNLEFEEDKRLRRNSAGFGSKSLDRSASRSLIAFDRHTGKVLWQIDARSSFLHNGIVAGNGVVYCLDKLPSPVESKLIRRGQQPSKAYRILALNYLTGETIWENQGKVFGTWLGYSEQYDRLLEAGASASDRLRSEVGKGMAVYNGKSGEVSWRDDDRVYSGPCILHHDTILTNANSYRVSAGAFSLLDGTEKLIANPITGEQQTWEVCRAYGCNSIIASENLLTFRSGAAGFYDLTKLSGTGNLGGFKSSCTSNLVVANGVLNAPDYTRTCSCGYQNQTSLALVHMPDVDMWTLNHEVQSIKTGSRIDRVGINFGAPGDRMDDNGTLWLDYPVVGGESAELDIQIEGETARYYRGSSMTVGGSGLNWVAASGVTGARKIVIPLVAGTGNGLTVSVQDDADDAEENAAGDVSTSSSDLELVDDGTEQTIGLRFADVPLPRGTVIRSAYLQLTCDETTDVETELLIHAIDEADTPAFSSDSNDVSARSLTRKFVPWSPPPWKKRRESGPDQRSPDIGPLIAQIINRQDWRAGQALALVIKGTGKRVANARDAGEKTAPRLVIDADLDPSTDRAAQKYTVRLHFAEPEDQREERAFNVDLQGKRVISKLRVAAEAGGSKRALVKTFKGVEIVDALSIELDSVDGPAILSGVEIEREQ